MHFDLYRRTVLQPIKYTDTVYEMEGTPHSLKRLEDVITRRISTVHVISTSQIVSFIICLISSNMNIE